MSSPSERRRQADRRKAPRGGRRPDDRPGATPLVLVVGNGDDPQRQSETILGALKFAVAPAADFSEAVRAVESLHPDAIVAPPAEASRLRAMESVEVPIVEYDRSQASDGGLVERLRDAMRKRR